MKNVVKDEIGNIAMILNDRIQNSITPIMAKFLMRREASFNFKDEEIIEEAKENIEYISKVIKCLLNVGTSEDLAKKIKKVESLKSRRK